MAASLWQTLVNEGLIQGDPSFYEPGGGADEAAYKNAISVALKAASPKQRKTIVDAMFDAGLAEGDRTYWYESRGDEDQNLINTAAGFVGAAPPLQGSAVGTTQGVMSGGTLTKITRGNGLDDLWGITYEVAGIQHVYTFDSYDTMERILGKDPVTKGNLGLLTLQWDEVNDGDTWLLGDAAAFVGQEGSYQMYFSNIMQEAALDAGVRNPGKLGEYLANPDVQRIIAEGEAGGWSQPRIQAELRNTDYYRNVMYPGIDRFLAEGVPNPEGAWREYQNSVSNALSMLGYAKDADGSYASLVGDMLNSGIRADDFNTFAPTFVRAEQSQDYANTLNAWTQRDLGRDLTFDDWFDVLEGTASADLADVVEKATLQFQAERTNTMLAPEQISRLAELTSKTEDEMRVAFSQAEQSLLTVGDQNLARFGLSEQALVNAAFGVETLGADPFSTSGEPLTATEVQRRAFKAAQELGLQDDEKAHFFVGHDDSGRPKREGLAAQAAEVG